MKYLLIETSRSRVGFVGRLSTRRDRPLLLAVSGVFPPTDYKHELIDTFPDTDVLVSPLPGMETAVAMGITLEAMSAAYDEALALLAPGRSVVAYGISTGALVTLGLRSSHIVRHVAQEPFFSTADLWPFIDNEQERLRNRSESRELAAFHRTLFGIEVDRVENRDYGHLLDNIPTPLDVIVGQLPLLPRRNLPTWPSFTKAEHLARLRTMPGVAIHIGPEGSGHHVEAGEQGVALVQRVLRAALDRSQPT